MSRKIFVNLPVQDLQKSIAFFEELGFSVNPQFTDETAACIVISEEIYAMLLTHPRFSDFTPHPISDATTQTEVLIAVSCENREEVDDLTARACKAEGAAVGDPTDYGFMYSRSIHDLDGHIWELVWMDPAQMPQEATVS
ncbi:Glyoxalase-like domain protein [Maioricimonas rarisocia]|uniref:Glyoxalase-like domain protein n=1 Tax=Maioricimonas rarisocia TaxID=2528026 RepID=A0A517ZDC5_9PLAN|nr:VOC family protein [Maioricimonas rarisocia]QDU40468.1 Glyoxalase-like domain protein [Maioricimonas rarisocia]